MLDTSMVIGSTIPFFFLFLSFFFFWLNFVMQQLLWVFVIVLQVHGEVTDPHIDTFDREKVFIDRILAPLVQKLPQLKIVMEHITTMDAVNFIESCEEGAELLLEWHYASTVFYDYNTFIFPRSCCCDSDSPAYPPQQERFISGWLAAPQLLLASTEKRDS
jgi:hypothetical protein